MRSHIADVLQHQFVDAAARLANEPEIREEVSLAAEEGERGTAAPEQSLPRQRNIHGGVYEGFVKLTFGTCLASAGASKKGCSLKPNIFAVRFAGN